MSNYTEIISQLPYERQLELLDYLDIKEKLNEHTIEIWPGHPEKPQFCHFNDVDNGSDMTCRQSRNLQTAKVIMKILGDNTSLLKEFLG